MSYGATDDPRDEEEQQGPTETTAFNEDNFRFLPESSLSRKEKINKTMLLLLPIVVAVAIMGGAAYFLNRAAFSSGHGGKPTTITSTATAPESPSSKYPAREPVPAPQPLAEGPAACSAHPDCGGLEGYCCPTDEGIKLECCKNGSN